MNWGIVAGDTNKTIYVRLRDATTGLAQTGLVFNSAGAVCSYTLPLAARAAIALATQTVTGAHSDGGFVEVDATNCKGLYRLDLPDAAIASGAFSLISLEFDGIIEESLMIELLPRPVNVTQWLGTAAATPTVAGVPEVDMTHLGGVAQSATDLKDFADAGYDPGTNKVQGVVLVDTTTTNTDMVGAAPTAAANADAVWDEARAGHGGAGSFGEGVASVQGNVTGSVGSVTTGVTVTTNNDKTGYSLSAAGIDAILQRQITETYNADGTAPTVEQALMGLLQCLTEFAIAGTTITVKKLDGSTTAMTFTLDDATDPTSRTRAT